jgi:hypothetical protein
MFSLRRFALLLALGLPAMTVVQAQSSSSSIPTQDQAQAQLGATTETRGQLSVQARIRQRREQRRATAIHDAYDHRYETFTNMGYLRFRPGHDAQRVTLYGWETGLTRYFNERLGATFSARGYYGTPFVGLNWSGLTRPAISQYDLMVGPTYRFYTQPKYSISGRVLAGYALGNFTGDTNGFGSLCSTTSTTSTTKSCLLYPDGSTYAATAGVVGEYNVTPTFSLRLGSDFFVNGFGSETEYSRGFTAGMVYRFGKQ